MTSTARTVNCSDNSSSSGGGSSGVCLLPLDTVPNGWHYVRLELRDGAAAQFGIQIVLENGTCRDRGEQPACGGGGGSGMAGSQSNSMVT